MNLILLLIIALPILEIAIMIKIGQQIGVFNTIFIIFFTAIVGIYYARIEGLNTLKSGMVNLYKNRLPFYEMLSGASIAVAAILLILPGFISDTIGFFLLFPFTRKIIINFLLKKKYKKNLHKDEKIIDAEIIEDEKIDKDEL